MSKSQLSIRVQLLALPQQNEEEKYFVILSNFGGGTGERHQSLRVGEGTLTENQGERRRPLSDGRRHLVFTGSEEKSKYKKTNEQMEIYVLA